MAIPVFQAIGAGLSAFNAANTVSSWLNDSSTSAAGKTSQVNAADQGDRFLKLLVAQMRNQDPLNPLDNAQVTTQMAQISTVTGVDKLNASVSKLSQSMLSAQSLQSAAVIGRQVLVAGSTMALGATGASGALELNQAADRVQVAVATPAGVVVRIIELGAQPAGIVNFQWDGMTDMSGRAPQGNYNFQVVAASGGQSIAATSLASGLVKGVSFNGGNLLLNLEGGSELPISDIRRIL